MRNPVRLSREERTPLPYDEVEVDTEGGKKLEKRFDTLKSVETHGNKFHIDEMVATSIIKDLFHVEKHDIEGDGTPRRKIEYTRSSASAEEKAADKHHMLLDKGLSHMPGELNFDHHQMDTPHSAAGLVWAEHGEEWLRSMSFHHPDLRVRKSLREESTEGRTERLAKIWENIDRKLITLIDANDTGADRTPTINGISIRDLSIAQMISYSNHPRHTDKSQDKTFNKMTEDIRTYLSELYVREELGGEAKPYRERIAQVLGVDESVRPSSVWEARANTILGKARTEAKYIVGLRDTAIPRDVVTKAKERITAEYWGAVDALWESNPSSIRYPLANGSTVDSNEFDQFSFFSALPRDKKTAATTFHPKFEEFLIRYARTIIVREYGETKILKDKLTLSADGRTLIYDSDEPITDCSEVLKQYMRRDPEKYKNVQFLIHKTPLYNKTGPKTYVLNPVKSHYWVGPLTNEDGSLMCPIAEELRGLRRDKEADAETLHGLGLDSVDFVSRSGHIAKAGILAQARLIAEMSLPKLETEQSSDRHTEEHRDENESHDRSDNENENETDPRPRPQPTTPEPPRRTPRTPESTRASPEQISAIRAALIGASGVAGGVAVGAATIGLLGLTAAYTAPLVISAAVASGTLAAGLAGLYVAGRLTTEAAGLLFDFAHDAVRALIRRIDKMFSIFNKGL